MKDVNKLIIITTNVSALLQSRALAMHSFPNQVNDRCATEPTSGVGGGWDPVGPLDGGPG